MESGQINILILGAGSVGSYITYSLVPLMKKGLIELTIADFDVVDDHNPNNQLYTIDDIGKLKVDALKELIIKRTGQVIDTFNEDPEYFDYWDIVINAVDDIEARKRIYEQAMNTSNRKTGVTYIETGTGMDNSWVEVNANMNPIHDSIDEFLKGKSEEELREFTACGARIFDTGMVLRVAGEVVGAVRMLLEDDDNGSYRIELFKSGTHYMEHSNEESTVNVDNLL